jgi:transcriptional regulator with XRE-family HTH domain
MTPNQTIVILRTIRGLTQRQLADKAGISRSLLGFIENEHRTLTAENQARIESALNIQLGDEDITAALLLLTARLNANSNAQPG